MDNIIIFIVLITFLPVSLLLLFLEKRARRIILSYMSGILICIPAYYLNNLFLDLSGVNSATYSVMYGPLVEETLKFIPLIIFCFTFKKGQKQTIAMSFALGVGFCVVENAFYLVNYAETANIPWIIARCLGTGLMHSLSTTLIGYGLYRARNDKSIGVVIAICTLFFAYIYHGLFNLLASNNDYQFVAVIMSLLSYVVVLFMQNLNRIKEFFKDDEEYKDSVKSK